MSHATDADKDTGAAKTWSGDNGENPEDDDTGQAPGYSEVESWQGKPFDQSEMGPGKG